MFNFILRGARSGRSFDVSDDGEGLVSISPNPPDIAQKTIPFRQYFTSTGYAGGSSDMSVDGSSINQEFSIQASSDNDIYIKWLSVIVGYGSAGSPYLWADGAALSNGIEFTYRSVLGETQVHDAIKSNQDFFRLSESAIDANWEVRNVNALNDYGYFLKINMEKLSNGPCRIEKNTSQNIKFTIKDNLTTATDSINVIAYGFERVE